MAAGVRRQELSKMTVTPERLVGGGGGEHDRRKTARTRSGGRG